MIVVAYYTNERYRLFAKELLSPSLEKHGLTAEIIFEEDQGDWHKNTRLKVPFLMQMLRRYKPEPILYIDADAEVRKDITDLQLLAHAGVTDLGLVYWQANRTRPPELLTGTMMLRHTPAVMNLLDAWYELNAKHPKELEQKNLQNILQSNEGAYQHFRKEVVISRLEPEYCWIEPAMRHFRPDAEPIIYHCQLSRPMWAKKGK